MKTRLFAALLVLSCSAPASAGQIGHYAGGLMNIRDFFVPTEQGVYGIMYHYYYQTGRLNDLNGNEMDSITIKPGPGPGLNINIQPDVDVYLLAPAILWVTPWKILGAQYAALFTPTFGNSSIGASLSAELGQGVNPETSQFNLSDWYFQPLWLGWDLEHWNFALAWGFYAPTGAYDTEVKTFPVVGDVRVADADNIGLGFWTNQFQGAVAWYPWANKGTAVTLALTYEVHSEKEDYHVTAGQNLTMNWGISQYLPLSKDEKWLAEIGPAGYDSWQVTSDEGQNATNGVLDQVHAAGFQVGITNVGWMAALNFHYFNEYHSEDRFEGQVFGLSASKKF